MADDPSTIITITVNDKEYELDYSEFTARECGILKRIGNIAGVLEIGNALMALDLEVVVALAVIAAKRAGVNLNPDTLLDADAGSIVLELPGSKSGEEEDPTEAPANGAASEVCGPRA